MRPMSRPDAEAGSRPIAFQQFMAKWQGKPEAFNPAAWRKFNRRLAPMPFLSTTLEVDEPLWGSFWQGDVIAPGYRLPALELAYLRCTRLDENTLGPTPESYLQRLQATLLAYPDGAWLALLDGRSTLCTAYRPASDEDVEAGWFIIWLIDGVIAAGYRQVFADASGLSFQVLRQPAEKTSFPMALSDEWLQTLCKWGQEWDDLDWATKIDRLIQLHRTYGHLPDTAQKKKVERWLNAHSLKST